jgi:NADH-quinone oxidoreductase subunit N
MSYGELLRLAAPETIVVIAALAALVIDLTSTRELELRLRFGIGALVTGVGCVAAMAWMIVVPTAGEVGHGMMVVNSLTQLVKIGVLALTLFTVLLSVNSDFTSHVGEYLALILLAAVGMMFLISARDVLMIFVALEMTSLSLYVLTAFNKQNVKSAEAALKYFLFGGMAAAFMLFGLSLLYGLSGSTNLHEIASALTGRGLDPLLVVAIVVTVVGFGFKVAAVPFHLWAPDAYEGAPTPSAAFIASGSKVASFFIFAQVMAIGFAGAEGSGAWRAFVSGWMPVVALIAALSMVLGNLAALAQSNVKRLIAYSAIAHAGYALLGILANDERGLASLIYYVITYGLTTVGAFGVVGVVEQLKGDSKLSDFAGLSRRAPVAALCMMIFMLSLAGIPPLAGFFGKFYVFYAAVQAGTPSMGLLWLVILAVAMSAVSFYYYLKVLKQIYVVESTDPKTTATNVPLLQNGVLGVIALLVLILGCFPNLLVGALQRCLTGGGH